MRATGDIMRFLFQNAVYDVARASSETWSGLGSERPPLNFLIDFSQFWLFIFIIFF